MQTETWIHAQLNTEMLETGLSLAEVEDMLEELQKLKSAQLSIYGTTAKLEFERGPREILLFGGPPIDPEREEETESSN
jgi:hypothetical protein